MKLKRVAYIQEVATYVFFCPGCEAIHSINSKWQISGLEEDSPTISPSVLVNKDRRNEEAPRCHSFIVNGQIRFLNDCTHDLAGKTVDLPDVDEHWDGDS